MCAAWLNFILHVFRMCVLKVLKKQQSNVTGGNRLWSTVRQRSREKQPACVQPQHLQCVESVNIQPHTVLARTQSVSAFHFAPSHTPRWHTLSISNTRQSRAALWEAKGDEVLKFSVGLKSGTRTGRILLSY